MKSPCPDREPLLEALLFDDLAERERGSIEAHLRECSGCREAFEDAQLALRALATIEDPPRAFEPSKDTNPDEAWNAFRARIETPPKSNVARQLLALAAVLLVGIASGWLLARRGESVPRAAAVDGGLDALVRADVLADAGVRYVDGLRGLFSDLTELPAGALTVADTVSARERARTLLRDGRLLERSLDPERDRDFLRAIRRAELFLEEIAALESSGQNGGVRLLEASLSASRLPNELARLDVRREVENALARSGSLADESLYRRKDF